MKRFRFFALFGVAAFGIIVAQCAKAPTNELAAARDAVASAKAAEAEKYAMPEFTAVKESLTVAEADVTAHRYKLAKSRLEGIVPLAKNVKMRAEAGGAVARLNVSIAEAKELSKKVNGKKDRSKDIADVESGVTSLQSLQNWDNFTGAVTKAHASMAKLDSIKADLNTQIAKEHKPVAKAKKKK